MLKIVTLTTLYPNSVSPRHGIFVEERLRHLMATGRVDAKVVAPIPWFPSRSEIFGAYAKFASVPSEEQRIGLTVSHPRYPTIPKVGMTVSPLLMALALVREISRLKNTWHDDFVIDSHYLYPDGVAARIIGGWLDLPVVITARGTDVNVIPNYAVPRRMISWAARTCSKVITVSDALRLKLLDLGVPPDRVTTLRNGIDLDRFHPPETENTDSGNGITGKTLLFVGNLIELKGVDLIIKAVAKIPDVRLNIIGEGPLREGLMRLIVELGIEDRVSMLGYRNQAELVEYYGSADALVLASEREGMPNVILESLACGTPVIASNVGGLSELVTGPPAGVLFEERTPDGIVEAFERLMADFPDRELTRRHAEQFGWSATIDGLLDVLADPRR